MVLFQKESVLKSTRPQSHNSTHTVPFFFETWLEFELEGAAETIPRVLFIFHLSPLVRMASMPPDAL